MLYHLLYPLHDAVPVFNVFRYITFRTAGASVTALALSLVLGPMLIRHLREFQIGQVIRQEGPQTHRAKAGTPTMGGLLILSASLVPTLLWADLTQRLHLDRRDRDRGFRRGWIRRRLPENRAPLASRAPGPATRWAGRSSLALGVGIGAADSRPRRSVQHAAGLPVLQTLDPRARLGLRAVCDVRLRELDATP